MLRVRRGSRTKAETDMSAAATTQLETIGFEVFRLQAGRARVKGGWMHGNRAGTPDRFVMLSQGRVAFLEAKFGDGVPSEEQVAFRRRAEKRGHVVITFWTVREAVEGVLAAERAKP